MATCLSDWPVEELPCVQADMSLLLIMAKQFCPGYSSSIFSQATPYLTFQFPPLCKRWVLTYFRLFLRWERRSQKDKREREQRQGTAGLISSVLLPVSPKVWEYGFQEEKYAWRWGCWRSLPHELQMLMLAKDCLLKALSLLCLTISEHVPWHLSATMLLQWYQCMHRRSKIINYQFLDYMSSNQLKPASCYCNWPCWHLQYTFGVICNLRCCINRYNQSEEISLVGLEHDETRLQNYKCWWAH